MAIFDDADIQARALALQQRAQAEEAAARAAQQRQQAEQARLAAEAERTRSRTAGELAGDVGLALGQTALGLGGAAYGAANLATLGGLDRLAGLSENFQQSNQYLESLKSAPLQARQQEVQAAFDRSALEGAGELVTTPSVLADYAVQSLGYLLPGAAAARAGAAAGAARALSAGPAQPVAVATAAQQAATRAGLAAQSAQTAGYLNVDAINAARDAGLSEGEQQARGLVGGAVGAVVGPAISKLTGAAGLEARAAQLGMGTAPTAGRTLAGNAATLGAFTGVQAVEEGAQESYEQMVRNWAGNKQLMADVPQAAATGAVLGGAFGATLGATQLRRPTPIREQLDQARAEQEQTVAAGGESPLQASFLQSLAQPAPAPRIDPFAIDRQLDTPPVLDTAALERSVVAPQQPGSLLTGMDLAGSPLSLRGATPAPLEVRQQMLAAQREAEALNVTPETSRRQIGLDLADAAPAIQTTATGQAVLPQVDLLGELTYPRTYEPPVVEQPATVVSRRQMGLDLAPPTAPIRVDAQGVAVAPGAYVPPLLDTAAVERQVRSPDQTTVLDTARLDASLLQPQDLPTVEDVFARFGPQVAAREQVRRSTLAVEQAARTRSTLLADEKAHRTAVRTALEQVVGEPMTGQEMVKLATSLRTAGVAPGDTDFAVRVGELVRARLAEIPDTTSKVLGKLDNAFRGDAEQVAVDRAEAQALADPVLQEALIEQPTDTPRVPEAVITAPPTWANTMGDLRKYAKQIGLAVPKNPTREWLEEAITTERERAVNAAYAAELAAVGTDTRLVVNTKVRFGSGNNPQFSHWRVEQRTMRPWSDATGRSAVAPSSDVLTDWSPTPEEAMAAVVTPQRQAIAPATSTPVDTGVSARDLIRKLDDTMDVAEARATAEQILAHPEVAALTVNGRERAARSVADKLDAAINRVARRDAQVAATRAQYVMTPEENQMADEYATRMRTLAATFHGTYDGRSLAPMATALAERAITTGRRMTPAELDALATSTGFPRDVADQLTTAVFGIEGLLYHAENGLESAKALRKRQWIATNASTVQEALAEQAVPAASLADLVARIDAAMNTATSDAELETSVRATIDAVLADPAYDRLSEDDWLALNSHIATVSNDVFGPKFELSERRPLAKPVSPALFTKGVITAASNVGRVQGFDTVAELEAAVGFPIPANAKGMYHNGNIYLVRENIASAKDLAYTLAHEVGHGGLDKLLGDSLTAATNRLWANPALRQRIRAKQAEVGGSVTRAVAAEEVLADMLASGERLNKDIWVKLRAGVREFFARVFGLRGVTITNAEVDALLSDVARVIRGAPAAQVRATMANPDLWISNPVRAAQQDPKFAKVRVDIDKALADAANEVEGKVVPFDRLTRAAAEAGVDSVKALGTALKMGKVGELWTHYMMHLDHLVSFYDKNFGGRLGTIAKLKELQQALFNRTLAEEKQRAFKPGRGEPRTMAKASINGILENWERFRAANPARGALLDYVQTESTFYKLFPTLPWDQQSTIDYATEGYTLGQRKAAYDAVTRAYAQMGDTARELYQQSQAVYADIDRIRWETLLDEVDRQGKLTEEVVTDKDGHQQTITRIKGILQNAMHASKAGSYSPLQRYGQFFATVRNALGEVVFFAGYETQAEADSAVDTVLDARKAAGETDLFGSVSVASKVDWSSVGVSAGTIEQLRRDAEDIIPASLDAQTRAVVLNTLTTGLVEAYLQALPTKSFLKHALGRKNVAGYDGDALRGFANYSIRAARNIASIKYDGQIDSALVQVDQYVKDVEAGKYREPGQDKVDTTKLRAVAAAVRQQHLAAVNHQTSAFVSAATGASFTYMMTSPSQLFMNATQTALVTLPRMMAQYGRTRGGEVRVGREILRAAADYFKSRGDLLGPHSVLTAPGASAGDTLAHAALTRIREDGPLDQSQAHDIAGIADGSADALSPYWGKVMKWLSYFMHKSEVFNRQVTALAAARLEQAGQTPPAEGSADYARRREALAESGKFWIRTTHFNYDKANKPVALNTQVGTLLGQFRQYQIHMLSTMARDIRDAELGRMAFFKDPINKEEAALARRTLSYMLGAQLAFTGAAGTVLAPVAFAIADAFRALDDDEELVDSKTEATAMLPTWAMHGLFGMALDTNRISSASLLPVIGQRDYAPIGGKASDSFAYYVTQNLGPSYGLAKNLLDGSQAVIDGEFYQSGQKLLPKPAADAVKALYEGANGARDMRGVMYGQPSLWSGVNQFVGLRSAERRDIEQPRSVSYQVNQRAFQFKERMQTRMALAQALGDAELRDETLTEVMRFNAQYPDFAVRPAELVSAARARMRTEAVAGATGVVSSRLPGPTLDAYLGR